MKLIDIIWKEISVVKSQRIALLLIVLYPFLAIGLLGSSFSGISIAQMSNINIGLINELPFDSNIINEFAVGNNVNLTEFDDVNQLRSAIKTKDVIVGLKLSAPSENSQIRVDLFYDNSNLMASGIFLEYAKVTMQRMTIEQTKTKLSEIFNTMVSLGNNLEGEITQVNEFQRKLEEAEIDLDSLEAKLNQFDFEEIEDALDGQQNSIDSFETKNAEFLHELDAFENSFDEMKQELEQFNNEFSVYKEDLDFSSTQLETMITNLDAMIADTAIDPAIKAQLETQRAGLVTMKGKIDGIRNGLDQISNDQSELNTKLNEADALFIRLRAESQTISSTLSNSSATIQTMNDDLIVFKESIDEVKDLIAEARISKADIEEKLSASSALLSSFSGQIIEFSNLDPKVLAQPVVFYEQRVFNVDPFGILVSNATSIVLILTCLLLTSIIVILEKSENVSLRMRLSPTTKPMLLFGKIIGQLLIALVEATIIFGVAMFGFGINIIPFILELYLATILISLAFISLGLIIASFTKNQSTAILTSLLIVVPMLFLGGIILPLEFMEPTMQMISSFLPLTVANNILVGLIIKGMSLLELIKEIAILTFLILFILVIVMLKEE